MKTIETNQMTFKSVSAFQSALLSKYYNMNNMSSDLNRYNRSVYEKLSVQNDNAFLKALEFEILGLISDGVITMEQAISVGFDEQSLLID